MKKKFLSFVMSGVMVASCTAFALAAGDDDLIMPLASGYASGSIPNVSNSTVTGTVVYVSTGAFRAKTSCIYSGSRVTAKVDNGALKMANGTKTSVTPSTTASGTKTVSVTTEALGSQYVTVSYAATTHTASAQGNTWTGHAYLP